MAERVTPFDVTDPSTAQRLLDNPNVRLSRNEVIHLQAAARSGSQGWFVWLIGLPDRPHRGPMSEADAKAWVAASIEPIYYAAPTPLIGRSVE